MKAEMLKSEENRLITSEEPLPEGALAEFINQHRRPSLFSSNRRGSDEQNFYMSLTHGVLSRRKSSHMDTSRFNFEIPDEPGSPTSPKSPMRRRVSKSNIEIIPRDHT
jgi:hypothetical protein